MLKTTTSSSTGSSTPVMVTVWGVDQSLEVKLRNVGLTVPSVVSPLDRPITTSAVGWESSTTVNVVVLPTPAASVTVRPIAAVTVMPAVSVRDLRP
jgi:hypothetical protein